MNGLENIARQFVSFNQWLGADIIGNGNINDTCQIKVLENSGEVWYILQRINTDIFNNPTGLMENIRRVADYLYASDYPLAVARPLPTKNGALFFLDNKGIYWRCFPYLPNSYVPETGVDENIAREAARAYGAFCKALSKFPANELTETIPGFHDTEKRWRYFLETLEKDPCGRAASSSAEIEQMFDARPVFDLIHELKQSGALPLRVTHNDTKAGNILFNRHSHRAIAVIDLDTVMPGVILSDFGDMARTFVPEQSEDFDGPVTLRKGIMEALLDGFLSETADVLTQEEKDNLLLGSIWICGEQALRFLSDWIAGDVYYKINYTKHNYVRAKNQLALFRALLTTYPK